MNALDIYKQLVKLKCFTRQDVLEATGLSNGAADHYLRAYIERGYIDHIRYNLYVVNDLENECNLADRFQIACKIAKDAYISHHTAFEYYGLANQVYHLMYIASDTRFRTFDYDGITYQRVPSPGPDDVLTTSSGVRVTSLERTVVDSIAGLSKIDSYEETLRCIQLIQELDPDRLLAALNMYGIANLYNKTGYILEAFQDDLALPESFFTTLEFLGTSMKFKFLEAGRDPVYNKRWHLFAPKDPLQAIQKTYIPPELLCEP